MDNEQGLTHRVAEGGNDIHNQTRLNGMGSYILLECFAKIVP